MAKACNIPEKTCSSPFSWMGLNIQQVIDIVSANFHDYFDPRTCTVSAHKGTDSWKVFDSYGVHAQHQLMRFEAEVAPTPLAWFEFGKWMGDRLRLWETGVGDPNGNVLFIRCQAPFAADNPDDLERMADVLASHVSGKSTLLAVSHEPLGRPPRRTNIRCATVRRPWPSDVDPSQVDWNRDYGDGVAWKGHEADWQKILDQL
jgi:hypothetical protein